MRDVLGLLAKKLVGIAAIFTVVEICCNLRVSPLGDAKRVAVQRLTVEYDEMLALGRPAESPVASAALFVVPFLLVGRLLPAQNGHS